MKDRIYSLAALLLAVAVMLAILWSPTASAANGRAHDGNAATAPADVGVQISEAGVSTVSPLPDGGDLSHGIVADALRATTQATATNTAPSDCCAVKEPFESPDARTTKTHKASPPDSAQHTGKGTARASPALVVRC